MSIATRYGCWSIIARLIDRVAPVDETAPPSELDLLDRGVSPETTERRNGAWDAPSRCQTGCGRRWDTDRNGWRTCADCTEVTGNRVL